MMRSVIGTYIVVDPEIHHGKPTFRGTRIPVEQVLEQVAMGLSWEAIVAEWRGRVSLAAIGEALQFGYQVDRMERQASRHGRT